MIMCVALSTAMQKYIYITFPQHVYFKYYFACYIKSSSFSLFNDNICSFKDNVRLTSTYN